MDEILDPLPEGSRCRCIGLIPDGGAGGLGVTVEAQFAVGEYDVVVLSATDSAGLETWLTQNRYRIPAGAAPILAPYVRGGSKFFVARIDAARVHFERGRALLSPLRVHYDSDSFSLPIRHGLLNSPGRHDLIVHTLGRSQRYEAANRPNVYAPTNLDAREPVRDRFGDFYNALFDRTMARTPGAVVTEYAWQTTSCDPCPVDPLSESELLTLGADVAPSINNGALPHGEIPFVRVLFEPVRSAEPPMASGTCALITSSTISEALREATVTGLSASALR